MSHSIRRTARNLAFMAVALMGATACGDDEEVTDPEVRIMRLIFSTGTTTADTVQFQQTCNTNPAKTEVTIPSTGSNLTAQFLGINGQPEPNVTIAKYNLVVEPEVRFTRTNAFTGTITGGTTGTIQALNFSLSEANSAARDVFGPCAFIVRIGT